MESQSQFIFVEPLNLVDPDSTRSRVDVLYRINTDFFVPVKSDDPSFPWQFRRHGELLMELFDSTDVSRARQIINTDLGTSDPVLQPGKIEWHQGAASFSLPPGLYRLVLELTDLESERRYFDRSRLVRAAEFGTHVLQATTPLFVSSDDTAAFPGRIRPLNFGGNVPFGKSAALFLEVTTTTLHPQSSRAVYTLSALSEPGEQPELTLSDTITNFRASPHPLLRLSTKDTVVVYDLDTTGARNVTALLIPLSMERLPLRSAELQVALKFGDQETLVKRPFSIVWPDMPSSLRDVDYALDALRYITTERELDSLKQGPYTTRRKNLESFWRSKERNGTSAYSELMVQYYRRVDHAAREYGTLRQPDGSTTDRGKVFILNGPPSRVERTLSQTTGFQEVWYYDTLRKEFVFLDESKTGNYVLISTRTL